MRQKGESSGASGVRWWGAIAALLLLFADGAARAQGLLVQPVSIRLAPGQQASTLTVTNQSGQQAAIQVRVFAWSQPNGDRLDPTTLVLASPPLATIPPGGTQIVRLLLRQPALVREATYRLLLDEIPPPASPGMVRIALRLSIPIFAEPPTRVAPFVRWGVEDEGANTYVVATNSGSAHEVVQALSVSVPGKGTLKVEDASPYVLAGATRRWRILGLQGALPAGSTVHLIARTDAGNVDEPLTVTAGG